MHELYMKMIKYIYIHIKYIDGNMGMCFCCCCCSARIFCVRGIQCETPSAKHVSVKHVMPRDLRISTARM